MTELSISQAQIQFTKLLNKTVVIWDRKRRKKKAVIVPYDEYCRLITNTNIDTPKDGVFDKFVGMLDNDFQDDDARYQAIVG